MQELQGGASTPALPALLDRWQSTRLSDIACTLLPTLHVTVDATLVLISSLRGWW